LGDSPNIPLTVYFFVAHSFTLDAAGIPSNIVNTLLIQRFKKRRES